MWLMPQWFTDVASLRSSQVVGVTTRMEENKRDSCQRNSCNSSGEDGDGYSNQPTTSGGRRRCHGLAMTPFRDRLELIALFSLAIRVATEGAWPSTVYMQIVQTMLVGSMTHGRIWTRRLSNGS